MTHQTLNDQIYDELCDYIYESLVLNEITQDMCDNMLKHPKIGLDWLRLEKGINLLDKVN